MMFFKIVILCCCFLTLSTGIIYSQIDYTNANDAYNTEKYLGYRDIKISYGTIVYSYDSTNNCYREGNKILIPDLSNLPNGQYVVDSLFYGWGLAGIISDTLFQWDSETNLLQSSLFDISNLFVSPVSDITMTYGKALQFDNSSCFNLDCEAIIDTPYATLVYQGYTPGTGTYDIWAGNELINAGDIKNTGVEQKISQQQADSTIHAGYCPCTYGKGWRLPTDIEVGHINDSEGYGHGLDKAYTGTTIGTIIWTSSLFITYTVKRWSVDIADSSWKNCEGFVHNYNKVRCVFSAKDYIVSNKPHISQNSENNISTQYTKSGVKIVFEKPVNQNINFVIYGITGNVLIIKNDYVSMEYELNLQDLSNGIYFLNIIYDNNVTLSKKIIRF